MSIGRRHPEHTVNFLPDPRGHVDGRCVHVVDELMTLLFIDGSMIKRRDIIDDKRDKGNKGQG